MAVLEIKYVDPHEFNILGFNYPPEAGVNNTVGDWTRLPERYSRLKEVTANRFEIRRELFRSGYGLTDMLPQFREDDGVGSRETIRQSVLGELRYPLVDTLRHIFGYKWPMDHVVGLLGDFFDGLTPAQVADKHNLVSWSVLPKRKKLISAGFPFPPLPVIEHEPSWYELQYGGEWMPLNAAIKQIMGKGLRTLDLLYPELVNRGFPVHHRTKYSTREEGDEVYYFIKKNGIKPFTRLYKRSPSLFRSRTWS